MCKENGKTIEFIKRTGNLECIKRMGKRLRMKRMGKRLRIKRMGRRLRKGTENGKGLNERKWEGQLSERKREDSYV